MERTNAWIAKLLQEKGTDIYRMKGVLAMQGCDDKYVYQGVHMLFTGEVLEQRSTSPSLAAPQLATTGSSRAHLKA